MRLTAVEDVEIVVAHQARVTLRVGDVFLKVDPNQENIDAEIAAMALASVPTPKILWHRQHQLLTLAVDNAIACERCEDVGWTLDDRSQLIST